jgi:hypothetical protein
MKLLTIKPNERNTHTVDGTKWDIYSFDSVLAVKTYLDTHPTSNDYYQGANAKQAGQTTPEWASGERGHKTPQAMAKAIQERVRTGDIKTVKKIKAIASKSKLVISKHQLDTSQRANIHKALTGRVHVPSFLAGHDKHCVRVRPAKRVAKTVTLCVHTSCSGGVDGNDLLQYGVGVLAAIESATRSGLRINVDVVCQSYRPRTQNRFLARTRVQQADKPASLSALAFALTPGYFRVFMFGLIERTPGHSTRDYDDKRSRLAGLYKPSITPIHITPDFSACTNATDHYKHVTNLIQEQS